MSQTLRPSFGVVRRLFTPEGVEIKSLEEIVDGGDYVAAANERFKPLAYTRITSGHTRAIKMAQMVCPLP